MLCVVMFPLYSLKFIQFFLTSPTCCKREASWLHVILSPTSWTMQANFALLCFILSLSLCVFRCAVGMDRSDGGKDFKVFAGNNNNSSGLISLLSFYFNRILGFWIVCLDAEKDEKHEYKIIAWSLCFTSHKQVSVC